ncbi:MAG TPA: 4Fe-4S dicluster domain-containing protein [Deltaproteobacteria bacterium]|nr:4Fe-4S dicluster domain-containing protein [Deltaproteobacteria bacterium]HQI82151.1 4Fe-4S dicluster domain-containing protein [Deltaproteobacteria bacterium]
MSTYEKLRMILDASPAGAPASRSFEEILRILFTPGEAELATHMTLVPRPLSAIASRAGMPEDETGRRLEAMADKGIIFARDKAGTKSYGLLPTIPGLFEFPLMRGATNPDLVRLGRLWDEYHREAMGASFSGNPTPLTRVIPISDSVASGTRVHAYEEVARLIDSVEYIALGQCACRVSRNACNNPRETCLIFDSAGRFLVSRGIARRISREEAREVLDRAEQAGLVHTSTNNADKPALICNCCSCCCTILTCRTELGLPHAFAASGFMARIASNDCTGCGICTTGRCPMGAMSLVEDKAVLSLERCIGCGLCVSTCPAKAISLVRREAPPDVPATGQDLGMKVLGEKGKLEAFLGQMKA